MLQLGRYWQTARHLRPTQLAWWVFRRSLGRSYRVERPVETTLRTGVALLPPIAPADRVHNQAEFTFLNASRSFPGPVDWRAAGMPKLWRYNLHYFDYALEPDCSVDWLARTMADWIERNPPGAADAWEPYPVSLRTVNWIKFALTRAQGAEAAPDWRRSLFQQLAWLARNLEHEIQANHLLKNAKALLFGGAFFSGPAAERWLATGASLLSREVAEQILPDGGHYERSPMYHAIVLEDLLDSLNLLRSSPGLGLEALEMQLEVAARAALRFLEMLTAPDGDIPLFNDAALGIAPRLSDLHAYAQQVIGYAPVEPSGGVRLIELPQSGYFGYRRGGEHLVVDAGPIGPDHQPGHGHCDLLSFELVIDGRRVIVDGGVFGYESDETRQFIRSTACHNTVSVDGCEQSDLWGGFRAGRRARPILASAELRPDGGFVFRGAHDGYRHLRGRPIHERHLECRPGRSWVVADVIRGLGRHRVSSYLHFHPDLSLRKEPDGWHVLDQGARPIVRILPINATARAVPSIHCPQFGCKLSNPALAIEAEGKLPLELGYRIEKA